VLSHTAKNNEQVPPCGVLVDDDEDFNTNLATNKLACMPTDVHSVNRIDGNSGPLRGLFESKIVPGLHIRPSMTFESNSTKSRVFGIQAGFLIEVFTRKINIHG
jgi:hypothetical protein